MCLVEGQVHAVLSSPNPVRLKAPLPLLPLEYVGVIEGNSINLPIAIDRNVSTTFLVLFAPFLS